MAYGADAWNASPLVLAPAAAALILFVHGVLRLRRRGRVEYAGWGRVVLFVAGVACAVIPLVSPLDELADRYLLSAHMLEHVLIADVAPALILLAVRGPLLFFVIPTSFLGYVHRSPRLRGAVTFLLDPRVSVGLWIGVFAGWHVPALYDAALAHPAVHVVEHASFFVCGLLVWAQLIDPARTGRLSVTQRLLCAGGVFAAGQLLADVLLLWPRAAYPAYAEQAHRVFGLSPLRDQQFAALVMMGEQLLVMGVLVVLLLRPVFRREPAAGRHTRLAL